MFRLIIKKIAFLLTKSRVSENSDRLSHRRPRNTLSGDLGNNVEKLREMMGPSGDVVVRRFSFGQHQRIHAALIFIDGLADIKVINDSIIKPLMKGAVLLNTQNKLKNDLLSFIESTMLSVSEVERADNLDDAASGFLSGSVVLLIDGEDKALIISCEGWDKRRIDEPSGETVIRGPREGFTENLRTNTSLIRRKIRNPALTMEAMLLGRETRTSVYLVYIRGLVNPALLDEIKGRMASIDTDAILESGYIEQFIEDSPASIFATIGYTEKPDVVAARILEGRVAIVVDGTPFVLTVPHLFIESFQTAEDYYFRPYFLSMLRIVRYIAYFISITAPAIYVAVTTFHHELIPTNLLFTMANAREDIPFPAFIESLIMLVTFEILREAGIRLPRPVGQAVSIIGALVMGEAAVSAGLVGTPMVVITAITAISIFVVPNQADSAALLRLILLILAATTGGFGIIIGMLGTLVHLASLESFGAPYLSPIVPFDSDDSKDALIRAPLWTLRGRPKGIARDNRK